MIRLEVEGAPWEKNFHSQVTGGLRKDSGVAWHMRRRALLAEYGGKISKAGGKISFVFEDDKHATWFVMKWS